VFLDRDGVINEKAPEGEYVTSWQRFRFAAGALEGLALLASLGVPVIVVTNQRGIARGAMSEQDLADIHRRMLEEVAAAGGRIDAIYHCPHEGGCQCRKPLPGMFERAAREHEIDLARSIVIGDRRADMEAAAAIGARRRVLLLGSGEAPLAGEETAAADLLAAARLVASGA
jgi:D-glycero-D-manno-heptose 1,7-bisphosphate phosphatase